MLCAHVVRFIANDNVKERMKAGVMVFPHAELCIGSYHDFARIKFIGGKPRLLDAFFIKRIWRCQYFSFAKRSMPFLVSISISAVRGLDASLEITLIAAVVLPLPQGATMRLNMP